MFLKQLKIILFITSYKLGYKDDAFNHLKGGIILFPKYLSFYTNLANLYLEENNFDEAIAVINKGIEVEPRYAEFWNFLGLIKNNQKDKGSALKYYEKAVS